LALKVRLLLMLLLLVVALSVAVGPLRGGWSGFCLLRLLSWPRGGLCPLGVKSARPGARESWLLLARRILLLLLVVGLPG
jgi:hypothetical protein